MIIMNNEKILTRWIVEKLGLDKLEVITSDMLDGYTSIGNGAFAYHNTLTSISIPNSVTSIGNEAFRECISLTSVSIGNSVTSIGHDAFKDCYSISSITLPNTITSIGYYAFCGCNTLTTINIPSSISKIAMFAFMKNRNLKNVVIGDKNYELQTVVNSKSKAYKAFNADLTCRGFQYEEGKTYEIDENPELCIRGFHACLNLLDVFNYYNGKFGKDIVVHEVELEEVSNEMYNEDSKVVAKKITIGKRIL